MELDAAIEDIGFGIYQVKQLTVFFILQVADGCEVLLLAFLGTLLNCEWRIGAVRMASLTTAVFIGMFFGAIVLGNLSDRYGRKSILFVTSFIVLYASLHSAFSPTFRWMCFLRGWVGFGIAGFLVINSTLIAEISPRSYRACCQAVIFTGWGVGSVLIVGIGALVIPLLGWRYFLLISTLPVFLGSLGLFAIDESPRYLLTSGDSNAAFKVIEKMAKVNRKALPCKEFKSLNSAHEKASIATIFKSEFCSAILLTCIMAFVSGFTYYGAVFLSAQLPLVQFDCMQGHAEWPQPQITDDSCCSRLTKDTFVSMAISACGDLFAGIAMTTLIDRFGRKKGMTVCLIISTLLFLAPVFCMPRRIQDIVLLFLRCFTLTFSQSSFVYMVEIFPTTIRSTAIGICSLLKRVGGMMTPFIGQMLVQTHTKISLSLYAVVCVLASIILLLYGEETSEYQLFENMNQFTDRSSTSTKKNYGSSAEIKKK